MVHDVDPKNLPGAKKGPVLSDLKPMLATLAAKPFDSDQWVYEIKWDGYRVIAICKNGKIFLYSRNSVLLNSRFPVIATSMGQLCNTGNAIFDGEVVVVDKQGRSRFQLLQNYFKTGAGILIYYIFDILYLDKYSLFESELIERKKILKKIFEIKTGKQSQEYNDNIRISDYIETDGISFFNLAVQNQLEGIIAKRKSSKYQPGIRSKDWLKIKTKQRQEVIICGYTDPKGSRSSFGSLVTGVYRDKRLTFTGLVGGGLDEQEIKDLFMKFSTLKTDAVPFENWPQKTKKPHWIKPLLVAEVEFAEWTDDGLLRQPVYLGLRTDKDPKDVIFEKQQDYINNTDDIEAIEGTDNTDRDIKVKLTHPDKVFWPEKNITKKELFDYYKNISPYILPYIKNRLQSLNRCPDGIYGECFYQKDIDYALPEWLHTKKIHSGLQDKYIDYFVCEDLNSLLYMVNLGCIDIHPWSSQIQELEKPDFAILDLDPLDVSFKDVIEVAREAKKLFDEARISSFCKTSGSKGIHIYIPLAAKYTFEQVLDFIKIIAKVINTRMPARTSVERSPQKRHKKVYLDCYQNRIGQTVAAPYCIRPGPEALVSTPLFWEELNNEMSPDNFHIRNIFSRLEKIGDIWKGVMGTGIEMQKSIERISKIYKNMV